MKLKTFDTNTTPTAQRSTVPYIRINRKNGLFTLNKQACEMLCLKEKDMVIFHQDEEFEQDWYIEKVKTDGFLLRGVNSNNGKSMVFNNAIIARAIFSSVNYNSVTARVLLAGTPTKLGKQIFYGLLTSPLVDK